MAANGKANGKRSRERKTPLKPAVMRKPVHGHGLLRVGNPGNVGGGQLSTKLLERLSEILGLTQEELLARLRQRDYKVSWGELTDLLRSASRYLLPSKVEHSGPAGGPIPIEAVHAEVSDRLRRRLGERKAS